MVLHHYPIALLQIARTISIHRKQRRDEQLILLYTMTDSICSMLKNNGNDGTGMRGNAMLTDTRLLQKNAVTTATSLSSSLLMIRVYTRVYSPIHRIYIHIYIQSIYNVFKELRVDGYFEVELVQ